MISSSSSLSLSICTAFILVKLRTQAPNNVKIKTTIASAPVAVRVDFKLCVLVYQCLCKEWDASSDFTLVGDILSSQRLRLAAGASLVIPVTWRRNSATAPSQSLVH